MTSLRLLLHNTALLTNPVPSHRFQISRYYQMFLFLIYRNCIFLKTCILFIYGIYLAKYTRVILSVSHFQFMKLNSLLYSQDKETTTTTVTHQPAVTPAPSGMSPTKTSVSFTGLNNSQSNLHQLCCLQYKWRVWGMMLCQTSSAVLNYIKKTLFKKLKGRLWKRVWSQWGTLLLHIYDMNEDLLAMEGCHIVGWAWTL